MIHLRSLSLRSDATTVAEVGTEEGSSMTTTVSVPSLVITLQARLAINVSIIIAGIEANALLWPTPGEIVFTLDAKHNSGEVSLVARSCADRRRSA